MNSFILTSKFFKIFTPYTTLAFIGLILCFPLLLYNFPKGADYKNLLVIYDAFRDQVNAGDLYPKWLHDTNKGLGGTHLFFYPAIFYYFCYIIDYSTFFMIPIDNLFAIITFFILFLSGAAFYTFAHPILAKPYSIALAGLYMALPYHYWFEIYERTAMAEFMACIWIPLIFHHLRIANLANFYHFSWVAVWYGLLVMTHLPTAIFVSIFIGLYTLFRASELPSTKEKITFLASFSISITLGIGSAAHYLIPAITLQDFMNTDYLWNPFFSYNNWFLFSCLTSPEPALCHNLSVISAMQAAAVLLLFFSFETVLGIYEKKQKKDIYLFLFLSVLCLFLMSSYSKFLWDILPVLQKIQFPWRMIVMLDFLLMAALCYIFQPVISKTLGQSHHKAIVHTVTIFAFIALLFTIFTNFIYMMRTPPLEDATVKNFAEAKVGPFEYILRDRNSILTVEQLIQSDTLPLWRVKEGNANIKLIEQNPRLLSFEVQAAQPATLEIRQYYFRGWRVRLDWEGKDPATPPNMIHSAPPFGQINVELPSGKYILEISLDLFPEEKIGRIISLLSIFIIAMQFFYTTKKKSP